jgi:cytochrome oxidase Cu insertion factor (SCO1/SenC/PrrC family)
VQQKPAKPGRIEMPLMSMEIPDILLLDQNGKQVRLYSDLVKDKIVLVHFFFTKCSDVCPMQGRALMKLKSRLGQRLGRDVFVISISRDPLNDTPEELSKWGKLFGVGPGWTLATGDLPVIKKLLWDLTGEDIGQIAHESQVLIGNDRTGVWTSTDGLLLTDELVKVIDEVSTSSLRH